MKRTLTSLLGGVDLGRAHSQIANAGDHADPLGDADGSAGVEKIE